MVLLRGDATQLPLPDASVHCLVTSPPYNTAIDYGDYDDFMPWDAYEDMASAAVAEWDRVLVPGGRVWVNVQASVPEDPRDKTRRDRRALGLLWQFTLGRWFDYRDTIVWVQDSHDGGCAWGSWRSPSAPNLRGGHELIYSYYKPPYLRTPPPGGQKWRDRLDEAEHTDGSPNKDAEHTSWQALCRNVWTMRPVPRREGPACFPDELPERCIRLSTWPGEVVLDPFGGTGTTARVAERLGRVGISVDLSSEQTTLARAKDAREPAQAA